MSAEKTRSGGQHLEKRSGLLRLPSGVRGLRDILVVEDEERDAKRIQANLRQMVGYDDLEIRLATTLSSAVDAVLARQPELVLLDDELRPSDTAKESIPFMRRAGYRGPIVIVSSKATRARRSALLAEGASEVIHKDDIDTVRLTECLNRLFPEPAANDDAPAPDKA